MFGARADNRTAFCAAKTWFAEAAATARSRCGLRSLEHTRFFAKRSQRSKNAGAQSTPVFKEFYKGKRTYPNGCVRFFRLRYGDLRTPLSRSERGSPKRRKNKIFPSGVGSERFFREPQQRSKKSEAYRTPVSQP